MYKPRDYTKPLFMKLRGVDGLREYIRILKTPPVKYDADKAAEDALQNLRKQGVKI